MKKKILVGFAALAIAAVAALNVNFGTNGYKLSDISLANVEALAQDENGGNSPEWTCYSQYETCSWWGEFWGTCSSFDRCGKPCTPVQGDNPTAMGQCKANT